MRNISNGIQLFFSLSVSLLFCLKLFFGRNGSLEETLQKRMTKEESHLEFDEKSRSIKYRENRHVCEKGNYETYGYCRGNQHYSQGIHHIRLKFEKIK